MKRGVIVRFGRAEAGQMKTPPLLQVQRLVERALPRDAFLLQRWWDEAADELLVKVRVDRPLINARFLPEVGETQPYPVVTLEELETRIGERPRG